jgi:hypothetical protein
VQKKDFTEWLKEARSRSFPKTAEDAVDPKTKVPKPNAFKLAGIDVEWAIGMLWPDQSYTALRMYRGTRRDYWDTCPFHDKRLDLFHGKYNETASIFHIF